MAINPKRQLANRRPNFQRLEDRRLLALDTVAGSGVTAQYFNDPDLSQWIATRNETSIDHDWGSGAPLASLNSDSFSARLLGQVEATFTEDHTFELDADGGARLWVNGVKVIDHWTDANVNASATVDLIAGRRYDIQLEFRETGGDANVSLRWSSPSMSLQAISTSRLFATEMGSVQHRTWDSVPGDSIEDLTSLVTFPNEPDSLQSLPSLELGSSDGSPKSGLITGAIHPPTSGNYRFYLTGDSQAELWLSNTADATGKQRIALNTSPSLPGQWTNTDQQQSMPINLVAGQSYAIEVIYRGGTGADRVAVGWQRPGSLTVESVPSELLSPPVSTVEVFAKQVQVVKGSGTPIEFEVRRSDGPTTLPLVVSYSLRGSATPGVDFINPAFGTVTIPASQDSAVVSILPLNDLLPDDADSKGNEEVILEIVDQPGYDVGLISQRRGQATIADVANPPPAPLLISPATPFSSMASFGGTFSSITPVPSDVPATPYTNIVQAEISQQQPNAYYSQLRIENLTGIETGDLLLADFWIRSIGGAGRVTAIAENADTYEKSLLKAFEVPTSWTRVQLPFVSVEDFSGSGNELDFGFFIGDRVQTVEFADIHLYHYGPPANITPSQLNLYGSEFGTASSVTVSSQPFTDATRIQTVTVPPNGEYYRFQFGGTNQGKISSGDVLQFEFYARGINGVAPRIDLAIQTTDNYENLVSQSFSPTSLWQKHTVDVTVGEAFAIDDLQAVLNLGFVQQTVEIADVRWTNTSNTINFDDLPSAVSSVSYGGRDGDEAWRSTAEDGIVDNRQAELTIKVADSEGVPIDGAVVSIRQTDHSFRFGSAITSFGNMLDPDTTNTQKQKYQSEINRLFNTVVLENSLKWPLFEKDRGRGIAGVTWIDAQGDLYQRGHNVVWPSTHNMPQSVWNQYNANLQSFGAEHAADELRQTIEDRIRDMAISFAGSIGEWDVVNEPFDNNDVMDVLGDDVVIDWFALMGELDPGADRVLNDYDIFARNGNNTDHVANFDSWLTRLTDAGVIERIGEQSHYDEGNLTDMTVLSSLIDSYSTRFNLPIAITEFDITSNDQQLQADYLRDYMTTTFSHGAVDEFLHWGFWENSHWRPDAAMYNADFSIRPHGQVYEDLVFGDWWSDTRGTTRADGLVSANVFKGNYEITIQYGEQTYTRLVDDVVADMQTTIALPITVGPSPLSVESVEVADTSGQRSMVRQIIIEFDGLADVAADAVKIEKVVGTEPVDLISIDTHVTDSMQGGVPSRTEIKLTFSALDDGEYRLTIAPEKITRRGTPVQLDGDGDGTSGGEFRFGASSTDRFYALFGDSNGDAVVGLIDFASFRSAFGTVEGQADYFDAFDSDADGRIGLADFAAFRSNFGSSR